MVFVAGARGEPDFMSSRASEGIIARWLSVAALLCLCLLGAASGHADEELDYGLETHRLERIELTGNETFGDGDLKDVSAHPGADLVPAPERAPLQPLPHPDPAGPHPKLLPRPGGSIRFPWGWTASAPFPEQGDILHISILEGPRTIIRSVSFTPNDVFTEEELRKNLALLEGRPRAHEPECLSVGISTPCGPSSGTPPTSRYPHHRFHGDRSRSGE